MKKKKKGSGWYGESRRHALASKGIKTAQKMRWVKAPTTPAGEFYFNKSDNKLYEKKGDKYVIADRDPYFHPVTKDTDGDGVPDYADCDPNDPTKQDTNFEVGEAFRRGELKAKSLNLKIVDKGDKTLLVGYDWAVYGMRDKKTGEVTFFSGWDGFSRTTSKQLSTTGLRVAGKVSERAPRLSDFDIDTDGDRVSNAIDCQPYDPTKQDDEPVKDVDDIISDLDKKSSAEFTDIDEFEQELPDQPDKSSFKSLGGRAVALGRQGLNYASNMTKQYYQKKREFNEEIQNLSDKQLRELAVRYRGGGILFDANPYEDELVRRERERQQMEKRLKEAKKPKEPSF